MMITTFATKLGGISALLVNPEPLILKVDTKLETPIPKTILTYLPHSKTADEVLAVCTVMTAMCDVFLYGVGTKKAKIQKSMDEFSKDAGSYAGWDTGDEGGFSFRFHSFIEDPTSYEACHSGVLVLDIAKQSPARQPR